VNIRYNGRKKADTGCTSLPVILPSDIPVRSSLRSVLHPHQKDTDLVSLEPALEKAIIEIVDKEHCTRAQALKKYRDCFDKELPHISSSLPERKSVPVVPFGKRARRKVNPRHLPSKSQKVKEKKKKEAPRIYIGG